MSIESMKDPVTRALEEMAKAQSHIESAPEDEKRINAKAAEMGRELTSEADPEKKRSIVEKINAFIDGMADVADTTLDRVGGLARSANRTVLGVAVDGVKAGALSLKELANSALRTLAEGGGDALDRGADVVAKAAPKLSGSAGKSVNQFVKGLVTG